MKIYLKNKDIPLYKIFYYAKGMYRYNYSNPGSKMIMFQSDDQYDNWLKYRYANAESQFDVEVYKRKEFILQTNNHYELIDIHNNKLYDKIYPSE